MSEEEQIDYSETWNSEALVAKAQRYAENMLASQRDDWQFALWSSLTLEFLLRAALADYDPVLLADAKGDWNNVLSAAGYEPKKPRFIPRTIGTKEVVDRLAAIVPGFTSEMAGFATRHTTKRNAELHSGTIAFDGAKHSTWLPQYYQTTKILLIDLGHDLGHIFGDSEAATAEKLIAALADDAAKAVTATIELHKEKWKGLNPEEQAKASTLSELWATQHRGHRVECPACKSTALVIGDAISSPKKTIKGDVITEKQEHLPNKFECIACGMKIAGLSQLTAAGIGGVYAHTQTYDAGEYYSPGEPDEYDGWEPDNNEPV